MALSPTTTLKLKNKACAYKMKHGSPRLQEVLREKCRERMRQKRDQLFNKHRLGLEIDTKDTLMDIVHEEFKNIVTTSNDNVHLKFTENDEPLSLEAAIELENEIIHEEEQWILQEYEKIWQHEVEHLITYIDNIEESKDVFCPVCQKALLIEDSNCVHCTVCELKLDNRKLEEVRFLINKSISAHAFGCVHPAKFTVISDDCNFNLYLICKSCSTLALIC